MGVEVLRVEAFDPDLSSDLVQNPNNRSSAPQLVFSLVDGNVDFFAVGRLTGVVTVVNPNLSKDRYQFNIKVRCRMLHNGAGQSHSSYLFCISTNLHQNAGICMPLIL